MAPKRANLAVAFVLCFALVWRMAAWKGKGTGPALFASGAPSSSSLLAVNETLATRELADVVHRVASAVSAASMIQRAVKLADESEAMIEQTAGGPEMEMTRMYLAGFKLSLTAVDSALQWPALQQTATGAVKLSEWAQVTVESIPGVRRGDWFAFTMTGGPGPYFGGTSPYGVFVYKAHGNLDGTSKINDLKGEFIQMMATGASTGASTKEKPDLSLSNAGTVEPPLPALRSVAWFQSTIPAIKAEARIFAWLAPGQLGAGAHGSFIYQVDKVRGDFIDAPPTYSRFDVS